MQYSAVCYTHLGAGLILIPVSVFVLLKIFKGSKSNFAYILIIFTLIDGVQKCAVYFVLAYRRQIYNNGQIIYVVNYYAFSATVYVATFVSLQLWIFAFQYLESASTLSLTTSYCSNRIIRIVFWVGVCVYTIVLLVTWIWKIVTFPGYQQSDSLN